MRRRTFISSSLSAGLVSAVRAEGSPLKPGDIPQRILGKTGQSLTIIGQAGGRFPNISFEEAKAVTMRAYELGINTSTTPAFTGMVSPKKYMVPCSLRSARIYSSLLNHRSVREPEQNVI